MTFVNEFRHWATSSSSCRSTASMHESMRLMAFIPCASTATEIA